MMIRGFILVIALFMLVIGCDTSGWGKSGANEIEGVTSLPDTIMVSTGPITASPQISFDTLVNDIGTIAEGERVIAYFDYLNSGGKPLIISEITAGCGCTVPEWDRSPLAPGKSATFKVVFNSSGKKGIQNIRISVSSNARDSKVDLRLKGIVESN